MKLSGAGFQVGTKVKIVFEAHPRDVVAARVTGSRGTFKAAIKVPRAGSGKQKLRVVGTAASGKPASLEMPVVVLATRSITVPDGPGLAEPVLLTLSLVIPLATWLVLEMFGWRHRRLDRHTSRA